MPDRQPNPDLLLRTEKRCPACGKTKPRSDFYAVKSSSDGLAGYCKSCAKLKAIAYQKANPDKKRDYDRRTNANNPDRLAEMRERLDRWEKENPEKAKVNARSKMRRYAEEHPERLKEAAKRYRSKPEYKERRRLQARDPNFKSKRNEREAFARFLFRTPAWYQVVHAFEYGCAYCGVVGDIEVDHLDAVERGGKHEIGNVVPVCKSCNSSKNDMTLEAFCKERWLDVEDIRRRASLR